MKKKLLSLALALVLCLGLTTVAFAADASVTRLEFAKLLMPYVTTEERGELPSDCSGLSQEEKDAVAAAFGAGWFSGDGDGNFRPYDTMSYVNAATVIAQAVDPDLEFSTNPQMPAPTADDVEWEVYERLDQEWIEKMGARFPAVPQWFYTYADILCNKGVLSENAINEIEHWSNPISQETAEHWIKAAFSPSTPDLEPPPTKAPAFADVKESDFFADAVHWAVDKNITSGTGATTFSPNATCNRAQILTFLWRANGYPEPTGTNPFTDIKPADYYYKAALWAAEKGLVSGSTFGADTDCTRASTMEYMWKAAGSPAPSGKANFKDVSSNANYAQAVAWAVESNVTSGTSETTFSPADTCTRGQIVTFLHRAMG